MKNWFPDKYHLYLIGIIILTAIIYRDSFTSPFFQDDKLLLKLAKEGNRLTPIAHFPYRPLAIQFFYWLGKSLFGSNVVGYHLLEFAAFAGSLFFLFALAKKFLADSRKALATVFFYALNISLFANFYWIATSYFSLGALFFFGCLYFYTETTRGAGLLTWIFFLLALGSNELTFVLLLAMILVSWLTRSWPKRLWMVLAATPLILALRVALIGFPQVADYTLKFNSQVLGTVRWYLLRALNLPEGVNRSGNSMIFFLFLLLVAILVYSLGKKIATSKLAVRPLIFGLAFFLVGGLPFYFLPQHMSSYYLTIALFGPALIYSELIWERRLLFVAAIIYLSLAVLGLQFLAQTHWIILKNTGPIGQF